MPSSIVSTVANEEEDITDMPPIEQASPEKPAKPRHHQHPPKPGSSTDGASSSSKTSGGGREGERAPSSNGGPRNHHQPHPRDGGGRCGGGQSSQQQQQGAGAGPRPYPPRPFLIPGQIEEPTRTNVFVPPSSIFFTQRSIPSQFNDGKSLQETFDSISKREMRKRDLPMIDVVWKEGCYWTLSNRRLAVFSELERRGFAKQVKIKIIPFEDRYHGHLQPFFTFWRKNPPRQNGPGAPLMILRPVPGGMPEGWGGDAPMFSPNLAGEITLIEKKPREVAPAAPMDVTEEEGGKREDGAAGHSSVLNNGVVLPPLVKMSSSEDENVGGGSGSGGPSSVPCGAPRPSIGKDTASSSPDVKRPRNSSIANLISGAEKGGIKRPSSSSGAAHNDVGSKSAGGHNGATSCMCNNVVNVFNRSKTGAKPLSNYFLKKPQPNKYGAELKKPAEVGDGFVCGCGHEEKTLAALGKHKDRTGHACWNNNTYDSLRDLILNEDLRISCGGALV